MRYGSLEYKYAAPIANALAENFAFRQWVLAQSEFCEFSDARILHKEMAVHRGNGTAEWWRFHFTEKCRCLGCSGKETDILAVFEGKPNFRFALHFEVKQPTDKFKDDGIQSKGYPLRASCWANKSPARILQHQAASTGLFFSEAKRMEYSTHLDSFKTKITFEQIGTKFPSLLPHLQEG